MSVWVICAHLKIIRKKPLKKLCWPLGEKGCLGNSRNSLAEQHSPFGRDMNGQICDPSTGLLAAPVITLSHSLLAETSQEGSQPSNGMCPT